MILGNGAASRHGASGCVKVASSVAEAPLRHKFQRVIGAFGSNKRSPRAGTRAPSAVSGKPQAGSHIALPTLSQPY